MTEPRIKLKCIDNCRSNATFTIKNVSSVFISNMAVETFDLVKIGNYRQYLPNDVPLPISLGPNESQEFKYNHYLFEKRGVGYKEFQLAFSAVDDHSNVYHCVASKNVEDPRKEEYILGNWEVEISPKGVDKKEEGQQVKETKIFISHRSSDVNYAAAVVDFLEDLGVLSDSIVCTSVPDHLIPNGQRIYDWLRSQFTEFNLHMLFLLSDNYYKSPDCLNEMGAAWVTKTDSDVILLPGFGPEKIKGCIGTDTMAIQCDANDDILEDRIRQLRDKVCKEFNLNIPNERRWGNIKSKTIKQLREKESETEGDQRQQQVTQPIFDLKITALNKQVPGTAEVVNLWNREPLPIHKNAQYKLELCNNAVIRNLKVFGRTIETGLVKKNIVFSFTVCYMESPDTRWSKHVFELTRDVYPAGVDGVPKFIILEYCSEDQKYQQKFSLAEDQVYLPAEPEIVKQIDIEKTILMKDRMQKELLKPASELKHYSREELWKYPEKRFISDEAIIISTECQDAKWNTDGGFGKYEIYNFCDEGLLFWDNTGFSAIIKYYDNRKLLTAYTNRMLCLPYEKVVTYDLIETQDITCQLSMLIIK